MNWLQTEKKIQLPKMGTISKTSRSYSASDPIAQWERRHSCPSAIKSFVFLFLQLALFLSYFSLQCTNISALQLWEKRQPFVPLFAVLAAMLSGAHLNSKYSSSDIARCPAKSVDVSAQMLSFCVLISTVPELPLPISCLFSSFQESSPAVSSS